MFVVSGSRPAKQNAVASDTLGEEIGDGPRRSYVAPLGIRMGVLAASRDVKREEEDQQHDSTQIGW